MKCSINWKYILGVFAIETLMGGCAGKFLDVPPQVTQTPEDYYSSEGASDELVNAVYNALLQFNMHSFPWIGVSSITSDNAAKGSDTGDLGTDKLDLDQFTFSADAVSFNNVWEANYVGIARANNALGILPGLDIDSGLKNRLTGEVYFLRALFYWNLVRCFGGVPLITHTPDPNNPDDIAQGRVRATQAQIYRQIEDDLTAAVPLLPLKSAYPSKDMGRATRGAAQSLLAKVYMYQQKWPECQQACADVIASKEYSLVPDYATIWREAGENNAESIFEVQCRGIIPFVSIEGFTEVQSVRNQLGWGFNVPTQNLWDAYSSADVRRAATFIVRGQTMWDGLVITTNTPNMYYNQKAYVSTADETYGNNNYLTNKNLRILRFADVLLIAAEAEYNVSPSNTAQIYTWVDSVRVRAGLPKFDGGSAPTGVALRDSILLERRLELAMEYDRFFDLIRQGQTYGSSLATTALSAPNVPDSAFDWAKNQVFPIPSRQITLSGGLLTQNPGY